MKKIADNAEVLKVDRIRLALDVIECLAGGRDKRLIVEMVSELRSELGIQPHTNK